MMKKSTAILTTLALCIAAPAMAAYSLSLVGTWPTAWPHGLEPLRKQARSYEHMDSHSRHYAIRFTKRSEVESAWSDLLKVKSKGAPILLVSREKFFLGDQEKAGIIVHCPRIGHEGFPTAPETPLPDETNPRARWRNTTYLELVVDDNIVKWDRLTVPKGTLVIDERQPLSKEAPRR